AALQTVAPTVGQGVLARLRAPQPQPPLTDSLLTALLNDIVSLPEHFVLVLDDYHVIEAPPIDQALAFLLDHLPPPLHLVITTREDPALPLARLRARGQLTELRAADLRFTPTEAADFLNPMMGLNLSTDQVAALEARTEGWIAGLQLAALSLRGRENVAGFIKTFAGDNRYIVDYLAEEVLRSRPERIRRFLLQTSLLGSLTAPLCEAVTGQEDGQEMLETLERGNLFVVPLDDQRQWYRYHHLFADTLQAQLIKEQANQVPILHQRASAWYAQNGLPGEAIRHALAAEDFEQAADLIELTWPALFNGFQPDTWLGWVKALPEETVQARPVLSLGSAWALLDGGELEEAEARLREAERWLTATDLTEQAAGPTAGMVVVNEAAFRTLPASIASARAYLAQTLGDVPATLKHARRARDLWPEADHYQHGLAALFLGLAYWASGKLEAAARAVADGVARMQRVDNVYFQIVGTVFLAGIRAAQGRLHQAASAYEQSRQFATAPGGFVLPGTADLYVGLSELARERGDLKAATQHLRAGEKELAEQAVLLGSEARWYVAMARIKQAEGDLDGTLDLLHEAERRYKRDPVPDARPLPALKARVWLAQGKLAEARRWVRERG
ncbi:MAG TPA: helix-turn-helix transcriptional regulator, partial [Anaerolineae bacterium]|nr:helix-turn-helix transcriptional regulator [Anaerolineae bacterium]